MSLHRFTRHAFAFLVACGLGACDHDDSDRGVGEACTVDSDCAGGLECELEHGKGVCKEHSGDDGDDTASDDTAAQGCTVDADCDAGLECELENGQGFCKPHDGDDSGDDGGGGSK